LILHGEKDKNAPMEQAKKLRDRLTVLKKDFEIRIFPGREHDIGYKNLVPVIVDFFTRRLKGKAATGKEESGSPGNTGNSKSPELQTVPKPPSPPESPGIPEPSRIPDPFAGARRRAFPGALRQCGMWARSASSSFV